MAEKMVIGLFSGSFDRLTAAGIVVSGAAANDMDIEVFVLLHAARAFMKKNVEGNTQMSEGEAYKEEFLAGLKKNNIPSWVDFFKQAKELTNMKIHICGTAGKLWGGEKLEDFIDIADDIGGISEYITAAQSADLHMFI